MYKHAEKGELLHLLLILCRNCLAKVVLIVVKALGRVELLLDDVWSNFAFRQERFVLLLLFKRNNAIENILL